MRTARDRPPEEAAEDTSFARGLRLLLAVSDRGEVRADELAAALEMPVSTVYRYLRTLVEFGFVDRTVGVGLQRLPHREPRVLTLAREARGAFGEAVGVGHVARAQLRRALGEPAAEGETDDALMVLAHAKAKFGAELPVVLAGFSFGSFVQTRVAKAMEAQRLVLIGPAVRRFAVEEVPADTIVVHGETDDVVPLADVLAWARPLECP